MGTRALYLGWPEYAIHGTNKPVGVGMRVSHGCMHLYPEDILQLYDLVPVGTPVRVVNQPFVFGWHRGDLYMQAFGPLEGDQRDWQTAARKLLDQAMGPDIQKELGERNEQVRWDLVLQLARDPQGIPVAITDSNASLERVLANAPRGAEPLARRRTVNGDPGFPRPACASTAVDIGSGALSSPAFQMTPIRPGGGRGKRPRRQVASAEKISQYKAASMSGSMLSGLSAGAYRLIGSPSIVRTEKS